MQVSSDVEALGGTTGEPAQNPVGHLVPWVVSRSGTVSFQTNSEAYERQAVAITTNLPFAEWTM